MLMAYPTPENLHIVPTARDSTDSLALSSRNAYLTEQERQFAGTLYAALDLARQAWSNSGGTNNGDKATVTKAQAIQRAVDYIEAQREKAHAAGVEMKLDYIEMNDWQTFEVLGDKMTVRDLVNSIGDATVSDGTDPVLLSGALWIGQTRLIDNLILGNESKIVS
jgi:pantoate--beta-alanine ligase